MEEKQSRLPSLEPLEVCSGIVLGDRSSKSAAPGSPAASPSVREALEDLLRPCLEIAPCFVSFSGGRDSAALLSLATRLARQRGLADPVPVTLRFENRPRSDENDWQEMTIDHLGLRRWEIVTIGDELDPLGPVAIEVLRRHGLFWPPVAHRIAPLLEIARGHALVFGTGGDEVFSPWIRHPALKRFAVRGCPARKMLKRAAFNVLPGRLRIYLRFRRQAALPWLRPLARREIGRKYRATLRHSGRSWARAIQSIPESRNFELTEATLAAMARDAEVSLIQPFVDPGFLATLGESAPRRGFRTRAAAMELYFGDVLPPKLLQRTTKAVFDELHTGRRSRAFARAWDGRGLDSALVDPEALRSEWLSPSPGYRSLTAMNAAWLASLEAAKS